MTDSKKTAKYLEKSQKYRTFADKKQFYEYEKNQNATCQKWHFDSFHIRSVAF